MEPLEMNALQSMRDHGFEVAELRTGAEAKAYLLERIAPEARVGMGGSVTIRDIDVVSALEARGQQVGREGARTADVFLSSANAVTRDGVLVFIDGNCNRVGAILDGPREVFFVVSRSKLVDGGINTAVARIKQVACPQNARRLGLQSPCALTGVCKPGVCEDSMCRATVALERVPRGRKMTVLWVEEALGY